MSDLIGIVGLSLCAIAGVVHVVRTNTFRFPPRDGYKKPLLAEVVVFIVGMAGVAVSFMEFESGDAAARDPSDVPVLKILGRGDSHSTFSLQNTSRRAIQFDGARADDGVIFPHPGLTQVECRDAWDPSRWKRGHAWLGSVERNDPLEVDPGQAVTIAVETVEANGKPSGTCRIVLFAKDGTQFTSATF